MEFKISNTCSERKKFCMDCNNHFMRVRPMIKEVIVSKHFIKDLKDEERMESLVNDVLDCSHMEFNELHRFEENVNGNLVFRAKRDGVHIVYCVDNKLRMLFLRAIKNFEEYKKFIENRKEIIAMVESL
jgi:mRNA-degrading endonuclease RelE of RelBE toxin-antitoxin system